MPCRRRGKKSRSRALGSIRVRRSPFRRADTCRRPSSIASALPIGGYSPSSTSTRRWWACTALSADFHPDSIQPAHCALTWSQKERDQDVELQLTRRLVGAFVVLGLLP